MKHILLVEDDPSIVMALTEFLTGEDFETISAATQNEAEQLLIQSIYPAPGTSTKFLVWVLFGSKQKGVKFRRTKSSNKQEKIP